METTLPSTTAVRPCSAPRQPFRLDQVPYGALVNGYAVPLLVAVIVVCNLFVCVVLVRPNMRTATNAVLVAIAFSDSVTGLWPLPVYVRFFAVGTDDDWVPYGWCYAYFCLTDYLPTVFHTASIWLTVLLAAQRYACVCRGDLPSSGVAQRRSVVVKIVVAVYVAALLSQASRFVEFDFESVNVTSRVDSATYVTGCCYTLTSFIGRHQQVYYNTIYWFRVVFVHLIPCSVLVVLTVLLVCTVRRAQQRKRRLLNPRAFRPSEAADDDDDQDAAAGFAGRRHRRSRIRKLTEGSSTTLMLVTVVVVFLAVELPQAVTLILLIVQYTFAVQVFERDAGAVASLVCNVVILLSYPTNFFIYCAMSRAFRTTFAEMLCSFRRRRSSTKTIDTRLLPTGKQYATNTEPPAEASKRCPDDENVDGNVTVALVDLRQGDANSELIEEQSESHV